MFPFAVNARVVFGQKAKRIQRFVSKNSLTISQTHDIDILCVYPLPQRPEEDAFKSLCAEHTTVCHR